MKRLLFLVMVGLITIMMVASIALAAPARVSFTLPAGNVVSDVPFLVGVNVDAGTIPFTEFDIPVTSDTGAATFEGRNRDLFTIHSSTGPYSGGRGYRYYTIATGTPMTSTGELFQLKVNIEGTSQQTKIRLDPSVAGSNWITASIGYEALRLEGTDSNAITPSLSSCGDGVIGYLDGWDGTRVIEANRDGIQQSSEPNEACDTALAGGTGCSSDCSYIKTTHRITGTANLAAQERCAFGSRNCGLEALQAKDLLLAKFNAIFAPGCFPYLGHPDAVATTNGGFCVGTDNNPAELFVQVPLVISALKEYYESS